MRNQNRARNNMTALCIEPTYLTVWAPYHSTAWRSTQHR